MNDQKKKRSRGCLWALVLLFSLMIVIGGLILLASVIIGHRTRLPTTVARHGVDEYPALNEVWAYGRGRTKVITIPIRGFIHLDQESDFFGPAASSSQMALLAIRRATHDKDVRAIILDVDSGGGGITASDILYRALLAFREADPDRRIVVLYGDVAASGAYYISLAGDHIIARPTSITGSIGVLMQSLNMRELGEKIGIHDVTIKSGRNKDLLNPLQDMTEEQRAMLQGIVDDLHTHFIQLVSDRRGLDLPRVRKLADGRIFTAAKAQESGLVDGIGYWEDAVAKTAELLDVDNVKIYRYEEEFSFASFLRSSRGLQPTARWFDNFSRTRLLYRWQL